MRSIREELLELSNWKRFIIFCILTLVPFALTGCVEETVKIIIIPARTGGGGLVSLLFVLVFFSAIFDQHKTLTPEQAQQQQIAIEKQDAEQRRREEMDLPAGLTPSNNNFVRTSARIALSTIVVESRTLSPDHNFQIYSKSNFRDSVWKREELINVVVQNPDNLENAGLVNRRLLFNVKDSVWSDNVIVAWDSANDELQNNKEQMPIAAANNSTLLPKDENTVSIDNTQRQYKNVANDVDPSGL